MFNSHYYRRFMTLQEKFDEMYMVSPNSCWIWIGSTAPDGYGRMTVGGVTGYAHRVSYKLHVGEVPDGLELDHLCRIRNCVNWRHLEPVTRTVNQRRSPLTMAGRTHCKHGHEFNEGNTYMDCLGRRICRECRRATVRRSELKSGRITKPRGANTRMEKADGMG